MTNQFHPFIKIGAIILLFSFLSCSEKGTKSNPPWAPNFNQNDYSVVASLDWSQRWYKEYVYMDYINNNPHDDNGVIMMYFNGDLIYHPWQVANTGLGLLNSYQLNSDQSYLDLTYHYADKLSELGDRINGGIYVRYSFTASIHNSSSIMVAPWYSGFAQGMALSLFSRIYELTGNPRMKSLADSVFATMLFTDSSSQAWTTMIDSAEYYWIEEYPFHPPEHVFNGFMVGMVGIHDYYLISHDERCVDLIKGGLTTVDHYFTEWRNPGGISFYCLRHHVIPGPSYHFLVINLLRYMTEISGDSTFAFDADSLYSDYH
jgi:hypothetical protein